MKFTLVPHRAKNLPIWLQWQSDRGTEPLALPEDGVWVAADGVLVAGVGIWSTSGPWAFAEHLATDPKAPKRVAHRAVVLLVQTLRAYSAMRGKFVFCIIRHKGIARILKRNHFEQPPGVLFFPNPEVSLGGMPERPRRPLAPVERPVVPKPRKKATRRNKSV